MAVDRFLLRGHLAGSRHHRGRHHPAASFQEYQQGNVQVTPSGYRSPEVSPAPSGVSQFLNIFWDDIPGGLSFILIASVIGTLTGLLIMHNVTRRLRRITQAAEAAQSGRVSRSRYTILPVMRSANWGRNSTLWPTNCTRCWQPARNWQQWRSATGWRAICTIRIKQNVFAMALLVGAARTHLPLDTLPAQTYFAEAEALAEQTRQELTVLIRELRPARLADKGLAVVLRDYAEVWSRRMGIAIALHIQGERVVALDIEEALFRVAQEALANIAHHSRAAQVTLHLRWDDAQVHLTINDDGAGFDVARASGRGVGLASMRERVDAHHGTLQLTSTAGATTVAATIPLHNAEKTRRRRHDERSHHHLNCR